MRDADIVKLYWDRDERAIKETASIYGNYHVPAIDRKYIRSLPLWDGTTNK